MASIRADEITKILRAQIANYDQSVAVDEVGTVISVGDGIARMHGLEKVMAGEMLEFPHDVFGIALNLEEDQVGTVLLGEYTAIEEGDTVKRTRSIMSAPVGDALVGPRGESAGRAARRQRAYRHRPAHSHRTHRARRYRPPAGSRAAADRHQSHRLDDSDRPRPARTDHRRPADGQDRHHSGHDHQPEGRRHDLHLLRDRAEALDDRAGGEDPDRRRRHGLHHRGGRFGHRAGNHAVHRSLCGLRHGRILPRHRPARRVLLRRSFEARAGVSRNLAAAAAAAGTRGFSGRRFLSALAPAGTRRQTERQERRRFADGAAGDRDAGRRRVGLHSDQRYLHYRRPDLPGSGSFQQRHPPGHQRGICR